MGRALSWLGVAVFVLTAGCTTSAGDQWRWPWVKPSALDEQYTVPPLADARYSDYPTLPKSVIKPGLKPQEVADPKRQPGMGGPPGMMPGGRPSAPGSFMY
jgi:hypothetical protein